MNSIRRLPEEALSGGVVAGSAGNHAQAVAYAARAAGTRAVLVMPEQAPLAKVAAVRQYGGEVRTVEGGFDEAGAEALRVAEEEQLTPVHAFDAPHVVAGQGTIGLEIAEDAPEVRLIVIPLGGGGLASGIALAMAARLQGVRVVGVQAEACAPYIDSLAARRPIGARSANTICDGIAVKRPGRLHPAAGGALRGRGRDRDRRRGGPGDGPSSRALEAGRGGRGRGGGGRADARPGGRSGERRRVRRALGRERRRLAAVRVHPSGRDRRGPADGALHRGSRPPRRARRPARRGGRARRQRRRRGAPPRRDRDPRARDRDQAGAADPRAGEQPGRSWRRRGPRGSPCGSSATLS